MHKSDNVRICYFLIFIYFYDMKKIIFDNEMSIRSIPPPSPSISMTKQ